jgi:hypothetical protein
LEETGGYDIFKIIDDGGKKPKRDAVLTIVDHDCLRAAIFLPCQKTIDAEGVAQLYV